jgi:predicted Zn-dependent protease with MMP-like domain
VEDLFYTLIDEAMEDMPSEFQEKLDNVNIFVEPHPTEEQARKFKLRENHTTLFGLYEGIPHTRRGRYGIGATVPDKITLFAYPIMSRAKTRQELKAQIKDTLYHEIGHHFGMSEEEIHKATHQK